MWIVRLVIHRIHFGNYTDVIFAVFGFVRIVQHIILVRKEN